MFLKYVAAAHVAALVMVSGIAGGAPINKVTVDQKGTSVTVEGMMSGWKPSWSASSPNSFHLGDQTGTIRVCIWPDVMAKINPAAAAAISSGASRQVEVAGIVKEFRSAPEIHVKDGADVKLKSAGTAAAAPATAPGAAARPAAVQPAVASGAPAQGIR